MNLYIPPPKPKTYLDENTAFIEPLKARFLQTFDNKMIDFNKNIHPIFGSKKEYDTFMTESNNSLERIWRTRILLENTPRGNILMYYDSYKLGFSFYCDQKVVSYDVLNAVAMKYVTMYRCRHFFLDESIVPKEYISPLLKIHFAEDIRPVQTKEVKKTFAKLRDYANDPPNIQQTNQSNNQKNTEPEKKKNTFLYLGKFNNFNILPNIPKPKRVMAKFISPLLNSLEENTSVQKEVMSYKDFIKAFKHTQDPPN